MLLRFAIVVSAVVCVLLPGVSGPPGAEAVPALSVNQQSVATYVAGELSLSGSGLGSVATGASMTFAYDGTSTTMDASSANVLAWNDTGIRLRLPPEVHSGSLHVTVSDATSADVILRVYEYTRTPVPVVPGNPGLPLALDVDADGRLWINEEFHRALKWFAPSDPPVGHVIPIPQDAEPGIFAASGTGYDVRTPMSVSNQDIDVAADGSIWFSEGGAYLYDGANYNSSRLIHFIPATETFSCYNVPNDNAQVTGIAVDPAGETVWYAEANLFTGNAISRFRIADAVSDCGWDPASGVRAPLCNVEPVAGCHERLILPQIYSSPMQLRFDAAGMLWFTQYWGTRVGRIDPSSGGLTEFPLPRPSVRSGPGIFAGSGPFELAFDDAGDLWVAEEFDGTILRLRPGVAATKDCTVLDASGQNPCVEEVYVGSNGDDGVTAHTVAVGNDGLIWFGFTDNGDHSAFMGFVDTANGDEVVLLPVMTDVQNISGIVQDRVSGDVWFGEFSDRRIGRLRLASGDADGVADATDNCPGVYTPGQQNADRNYVQLPPNRPYSDLTWPNSDAIGDACDADADNDGLPNATETALPGPLCPSATAASNPLLRDSDGDMVLDGAECRLGSDPMNAASYPSRSPAGDSDRDQLTDAFELGIGTNPTKADTDGDRINDGVEFKNYASDPLRTNTDGDFCSDGKEIASVNADYSVNSIDQMLLAVSNGSWTSSKYAQAFDLNKDGAINPGDMVLAVVLYGPCT